MSGVLLTAAWLSPASRVSGAQAPENSCFGFFVTLQGTEADEEIMGTPDDDVIDGGGGHDRIFGLEGDDRICTGGGDDEIYGGPGDDSVDADEGDNTLIGEEGFDFLDSRSGDDLVDGGLDYDQCYHGDGSDSVVNCELAGPTPCTAAFQAGYKPNAPCRN